MKNIAELIVFIIAFSLVGFFTYQFIKQVIKTKKNPFKLFWEWLKNIWDSISGIG